MPDFVKFDNGFVKIEPQEAHAGKTYKFDVVKSDDGIVFPFEVQVTSKDKATVSSEESFARVVDAKERKKKLKEKYKDHP